MYSTLYGKDKKGNFRVWTIALVRQETKTIIVIKHGLENGKSIEKTIEISKGKNIGRANETTHYTQAQLEADSRYQLKIEEGYSTDRGNTTTVILPMLAKDFTKDKKHIIYPCSVQPKLDGVRCLYDPSNGTLYSRSGKVFSSIDHLKFKADPNYIYDGELYSATMPFQEFCGLLNKKNLSEQDPERLSRINYIIYDMIPVKTKDLPFSERLNTLKKVLTVPEIKNQSGITDSGQVLLLTTERCNSEHEVGLKHQEYTDLGYEGIIIRNNSGVYLNNYRSKDLQKFKTFIDQEFKVIGFKESEGLVIWVCETETHSTFDVVPSAPHAERKKMYKNGNKYIGKMLTVRYQAFLKDVPRFGIGIAFRDYE